MAAKKIKRVPITHEGELIGIVSFSDIAQDMDTQVAEMWSEWLELITVTKTSAQHRRGRGVKEKASIEHHRGKRFDESIQA
jgi:signal-transduction protein with cAMP-binding, CBS, and nucleotidyltransferase domain